MMLLSLLLIPLCVLVLAVAICRIDLMKWRGSKAGWFLYYVGAAYVAGAIMIDAIARAEAIDSHDVVILVMLCAYMLMTRDRWRKQPASYTRQA